MKLLLDTHVAIWALTEPQRIPAHIFELISDTAIRPPSRQWSSGRSPKHRLRRRDSPPFSGHEAIGHFENAGFASLDVTPAHTACVELLPLHHSDPFDRLMLAQAIVENMQLVTYDRHLSRYDVAVLTWS